MCESMTLCLSTPWLHGSAGCGRAKDYGVEPPRSSGQRMMQWSSFLVCELVMRMASHQHRTAEVARRSSLKKLQTYYSCSGVAVGRLPELLKSTFKKWAQLRCCLDLSPHPATEFEPSQEPRLNSLRIS